MFLYPVLLQQGERQCLQKQSLAHLTRFLRLPSPLGLGSRNPTRPPKMSRAATIRMGMKGSTVIRRPKLRLPRMEPRRPSTDWIPIAVDLGDVGKKIHFNVTQSSQPPSICFIHNFSVSKTKTKGGGGGGGGLHVA